MKTTIKVQRQEKCQVAELMTAPKRTTSTNFAKKNYDNLRKQQQENKRRKDDEVNNPPKEPFKLKRFQKVESVMRRGSAPTKPAAKAEEGPKVVVYDADYVPPPESKPTGKDYVHDNAKQAIVGEPPKAVLTEETNAKKLNPNYGKVPHYLENYKSQQQERLEQQRLVEEAAKCPPGMRLLPEAERLETLEILEKSKDEVFLAINRLPIASNTAAVQRRRNECETKLNEIETAIKTFSRNKVYVAIN